MKVKEKTENAGLKQRSKNLRSWHLVTSWQIEGETMETVTDFIFLGSRITSDGH